MTLTTTYDDKTIERLLNEAAERAAGFYYEKTKHGIDLMFEAFDSIRIQVNKIPGMQADLAQLKLDAKTIKHAVRATNQDLRQHDKRITKLEKAAFDA